jgi:signal transduction histidine kinase
VAKFITNILLCDSWVFHLGNCGLQDAFVAAMSSFDSIYKKIASSLEQSGAENVQPPKNSDPDRQVPSEIAHDLNNILAIIQGYSDRLLIRHGKDLALAPQLKVISEAAKRATAIIRDATPSRANGLPSRQNL